MNWDVIVVGGGASGLPCALFAARRGAKVLLIEASDKLGGSLQIAQGQLSAAGTKVQKAKGIADTPADHLEDILRISKNTVDRDLVTLAVNNAADTFDWLMDAGFEMVPEHPVNGRAHEPYSKLRYYWGVDYGRSIVKVLRAQIQPEIDRGAITVKFNTRVKDLVIEDGEVRGVIAHGPDGAIDTFRGKNIVLASGGYAANPQMFEQLNGVPLFGALAYPYSQGDGHKLAQSAGAFLRGREHYLSNFGVVLADDNFPSKSVGRANTYPEQRMPWEVYVNSAGQRFIAEDNPSVDAREHALLEQPGLRYWIIFDDAIFRAAPPLLYDETRESIAAKFDAGQANFFKADTLDALAAKAGLPPSAVADSIRAYNAALQAGAADPMGRAYRPAPIVTAPFYAIRQQGTSSTSTVGLGINTKLEVTRSDGSPIRGLYAVGELLGSGQLMGSSFCGGMMGTPALTFGRLLGQSLLHWGS